MTTALFGEKMPSFRRTYFEDLLESNFLKAKVLRGRQLPFFFRFMALSRCVNASLNTRLDT
jgi:hypothetical protein